MKPTQTASELRLIATWVALIPAAGLLRVGAVSWTLLLIIALATLALYRQADFPFRSPALRWSPLGPMICLAGELTLRWMWSGSPQAMAAMAMVSGLWEALFMVWFFRGYGAVIMCAAVMSVTRNRRKIEVEPYPWKHWRLVPAAFLAKGVLLSGAVLYLTRNLAP